MSGCLWGLSEGGFKGKGVGGVTQKAGGETGLDQTSLIPPRTQMGIQGNLSPSPGSGKFPQVAETISCMLLVNSYPVNVCQIKQNLF